MSHIYYRLLYECTLSLLFKLLDSSLVCLHEWNFPEFVLFSFIIYGLHGINEKTLPRINHFTTYSYFSFIVFPHVLYAILLQQNEFYMLPFIYYATKSPSLWYVVEYTRNYVIFALCNFVQCSFLLTKMQKKWIQTRMDLSV